MKTHLRVLTNSEQKTRRRCAREHHISYELGYRPIEDAEALRIGTCMHLGLEPWWGGETLEASIARAVDHAADPYEAAKIRVMLIGYDARWRGAHDQGDVVAVEREFRAALINPDTGAASRTFQLGGKIDVLCGRSFVEHKTTSEEIGVGSAYWKRLKMDTQISTYFAGAKALGHDVTSCLYDVIRKPTLRPYKATPEASRKYTKDGRLHAAQREHDETPEEYEARLLEEVAGNPDKYYQRGEVVRLESEEREAALDAWQTAREIREAELANAHPRNPDACVRFGRTCGYFDVCCGEASLEDASRFTRLENVHSELSAEVAA